MNVDDPKQLAKLTGFDADTAKKNTQAMVDFIDTWAAPITYFTNPYEEKRGKKSGAGQTEGSGKARTELLAAGFEVASMARLAAAMTRYRCHLRLHYQGNLTFADAKEILDDVKPPVSSKNIGQRRASLAIAAEALLWSLSFPELDLDWGVPGEYLPKDAPDELRNRYSEGHYPLGGLIAQITWDDAATSCLKTNFTDPARARAELKRTKVPDEFSEWHDEYILIAYLKDMRGIAFEKGLKKGLERIVEEENKQSAPGATDQ